MIVSLKPRQKASAFLLFILFAILLYRLNRGLPPHLFCVIIFFGDGFYNLLKGYTWLRSGADPDSYYAYYHSAVGMSYTAAYPERTLAVRPATHKSG